MYRHRDDDLHRLYADTRDGRLLVQDIPAQGRPHLSRQAQSGRNLVHPRWKFAGF